MRLATYTLFTLSLTTLVLAQSVPGTINYQGRLTDNTPAQAPVTATVPMAFAIYDAASGGALLWSEPASGGINVAVTSGIFNTLLGSSVAIPPAAFTGATSTRYLQITLNPGASAEILVPRQIITATGYANLAQTTANAADSALSSNVALLNRTPQTFTGANIFGNIANSFTGAGGGLTALNAANIASGNLDIARAPVGGNWALSGNLNIDAGKLVVDHANGRVGINQPAPNFALDVSGGAAVSGALSIGVRYVNCTILTPTQNCACFPGETVISGGGVAPFGSALYIRESRPVNITTWRLTCTDSTSGIDNNCAGMNIICARLAP